jgi:fatty-acyl-CoA synthase
MLHGDLLGERARLTPDKTALVFVPTAERLTYAQLDARASRCARFWRDALGLQRGDRFGVLSPNRIEVLDAFFAAGKSGVIFVPLGTRLTASELAAIVQDAGLAGLLYDPSLASVVAALQRLISIPHCLSFDDYASRSAAMTDTSFVRERCAAEDILALLYTSGTTGTPKGVMIPHRQVTWNGYNTVACWGLREDDVSPIYTPLYHAGGLFAFLVPIFTVGGTIVLHAGFDTSEIWQTIEREGCTAILGVPAIWKMLLDAPEFPTVDLSRVRLCFSGGAPLPLYIIEAYQKRGVVFKQGFGMTEVGVNCFSMTVEESVRKRGTIGKPLMFTETRIVRGDGADAAPGEVGELWIRGPHVCLGYWNNPEATAAALDADGWFHTGDLATRDEEGFHTIAGRKKDMIISGGVNIYPAEIEGHLLLHPGVRDGAVVGVPDEKWGEASVAFVIPDPAQPPTPESLEAHLRDRVAKFKVPRDWVFVEALPRTASGKVIKGELRDAYAARRRENDL